MKTQAGEKEIKGWRREKIKAKRKRRLNGIKRDRKVLVCFVNFVRSMTDFKVLP